MMVKKYLNFYKQASQMRLMSDVSGNILPLIALVCVCLDGHKAQLQCCNNSSLYFSLSYWSYFKLLNKFHKNQNNTNLSLHLFHSHGFSKIIEKFGFSRNFGIVF